jgi:uncharacterized membrane protein
MQKLKLIFKFLFAVSFVVAGFNHIFNTSFYLHIMPPYLPRPLLLVYLSGLIEIILGVLLLSPKLTWMAAWGLVALLIAVFPANLHMAVNHELYPEYSVTALWARLPLQFVLIGWAYWYTKSIHRGKDSGEAVAA